MERACRYAYLRAMGITPWVLRLDETTAPAPALDLEPAPSAVLPATGVSPVGPEGLERERLLAGPRPQRESVALDLAPEGHVAALGWEALASTVAACRACDLCETRTQTVFGVGNRQAELLVIGEAPGADEDRDGEPFVGRAGQLLNRMLAAIGLPRQQVYIANILKCRPPGNRDPRPEEVLSCQPYLMRQIELIGPRLILAVGRISAQTLLGTDLPLGRLRGRWLELGPQGIPLRVTYHPAYLLRSPDQKARAWEDLTAVARRLGG